MSKPDRVAIMDAAHDIRDALAPLVAVLEAVSQPEPWLQNGSEESLNARGHACLDHLSESAMGVWQDYSMGKLRVAELGPLGAQVEAYLLCVGYVTGHDHRPNDGDVELYGRLWDAGTAYLDALDAIANTYKAGEEAADA